MYARLLSSLMLNRSKFFSCKFSHQLLPFFLLWPLRRLAAGSENSNLFCSLTPVSFCNCYRNQFAIINDKTLSRFLPILILLPFCWAIILLIFQPIFLELFWKKNLFGPVDTMLLSKRKTILKNYISAQTWTPLWCILILCCSRMPQFSFSYKRVRWI